MASPREKSIVSRKIDTLIIGAGQAGIATSRHLTELEVPHVVLERDRIAERWRSQRWDSLVANGPAWHDRFPELEFPGIGADDFATKSRRRRSLKRRFACYPDVLISSTALGAKSI